LLRWSVYGAIVIAMAVPGLLFKAEDFSATWQHWAAIAIAAFLLALLFMSVIASVHRLTRRNGRE
jgi:predicted Na+-dependent transporter